MTRCAVTTRRRQWRRAGDNAPAKVRTSLRYDVAIIGAGADGLAAAALLGRAGLRTVVIERNERRGGRAVTREFHPGFRASPFADELAPIPAQLYWALDLARRGAIFLPAPLSTALWPDRQSVIRQSDSGAAAKLLYQAASAAEAVWQRAERESTPRTHAWFARLGAEPAPQAWPASQWLFPSLHDAIAGLVRDEDDAAHLAVLALAGRAADPFQAGTAVQLLASARSGTLVTGLSRLGDALAAAATEAGVELRCGLEAAEVRVGDTSAGAVVLADGTEIEARAILSTLDLKRSFLSLFQWNALSPALLTRVRTYRMAGGTARLLLALDRLPDSWSNLGEALRGPLHLAPDCEDASRAYAAWHAGLMPELAPLSLRAVSAADPSLAPPGAATVTATVACVPHRLFDGAWTHAKREELRGQILARIDAALPGTSAHILGSELILPPDMEEQIGATAGDLGGGEFAPDQMLDLRPGLEGASGARSPISGFYLAGPSTAAGPLATCASGALAAAAILADLKRGRLK
jgi:phytoene dehydrogenase-like protein